MPISQRHDAEGDQQDEIQQTAEANAPPHDFSPDCRFLESSIRRRRPFSTHTCCECDSTSVVALLGNGSDPSGRPATQSIRPNRRESADRSLRVVQGRPLSRDDSPRAATIRSKTSARSCGSGSVISGVIHVLTRRRDSRQGHPCARSNETPSASKQVGWFHWLCSQNPAQSPHRTPTRCGARGEELQANRFSAGPASCLSRVPKLATRREVRGLSASGPNARLN
jgi:hypothetical protein